MKYVLNVSKWFSVLNIDISFITRFISIVSKSVTLLILSTSLRNPKTYVKMMVDNPMAEIREADSEGCWKMSYHF